MRSPMLYWISLALVSTFSFVAAKDGSTLLKRSVSSEALQDLISREALLAHAEKLEEFAALTPGNRAFGSKGHEATIGYVKQLLEETEYYDVEYQTFEYAYSESKASVTVAGEQLYSSAFTYAPGGDVSGPIVLVNNLGCQASDHPDLTGTVALIKRGDCEYGLKVALAGAAGASGVIIYNNVEGLPPAGTLAQPSRPQGPYVPSGHVSAADGAKIIAQLEGEGEVVASIQAVAIDELRSTSNVIATTRTGDRGNVIVAGAHSDSVPAGPGLNDDGSGSIGILEVALNLPKFQATNAVRFIWWSAEEFGLIGSEYYVQNLPDEERQKIALYLNFDMIASPNAGIFVFDGDGNATDIPGPPGSEVIETLYRAYFDGHGIKAGDAIFGGSSDYQPFVDVGVPSGGLMTGASGVKTTQGAEWWGGEAGVAYDVCYHQACDTVANLNVDVWERNSKAIAHGIATYANSIEGIPRAARPPVRTLRVSKLSYEQRLHLSCDHEEEAI